MNIIIGALLILLVGLMGINARIGLQNNVPTPTPYITLLATPTLTPTPIITQQTNNNLRQANQPDWSVTKVDEHITLAGFPADDRMATPDELFVAINNYRVAHLANAILKDDLLCQIAQTRADQLLKLGKLDNHDGFVPLAEQQQSFSNMGEILEGGHQPNLAVHIVEFGWARSLTGHNEAMLDREWTHGCGGIAGYFAVFIFGSGHR